MKRKQSWLVPGVVPSRQDLQAPGSARRLQARPGMLVAGVLLAWMSLASFLPALPRPLSTSQKTARQAEQKKEAASPKLMSASTFSGLKFRMIGPAVTSGRVVALAVNPADHREIYVGAASGGVWKTTNAGLTWKPVFDHEGSYSIGAIAIDPSNPSTVWVGTGEANAQRSVSYGDGVYRSDDGGRSWKNMGLKKSEHVGRILIDPGDSSVVYVAAQGPLWNAGGDRGLFKTVDGGKTWEAVLKGDENTGVADAAMDPRDSQILYASTWQRRRRVWTLIDGGPESGLYKSIDGGKNWTRLKAGLPGVDLGRIGLAVSPVNPDVVYASVEAADGKGGVFRSKNRGATWEKRNSFDTTAMYYGQIVADPASLDRLYVMNFNIMVSDDGGKTLHRLNSGNKHVDNHVLWVDPDDAEHYLVGCDGGVYESPDRGATWRFFSNLPITQFYRVAVDHDAPFYHVYGGTQDNFSLGGPARTRNAWGIINTDWFVTQGGDGFWSQVDPEDPAIVYSESQYGGLVRYDRHTGERVDIKPREGEGEAPLRWNWDAPLIISPHDHNRIYFAANKLFRSQDRGSSWTAISGEVSRALDRNTLKVMGKLWGPDAVAKDASTSFYGNATSLSESPLVEGLLYLGTDDGVLNVSENDGQSWRRQQNFPGVPEMAYVSRVVASRHDAGTVYVAFDNHKSGDFAPYLLKSTDRGRTWQSIASNLPENGPVYALVEDDQGSGLLFAGTEFGIFFTSDGGRNWVQLKGGLPTIAVRDLAIQPQQHDLVAATFGRGFVVLDDYTPLRGLKKEALEKEAALFPVSDALLYVQKRPLGGGSKGFQGDAFFTAPNPPFGATFTYYLKESLKSARKIRREKEKQEELEHYPSPEELRMEEEEESPAVLLTVRDAQDRVVRTLSGSVQKGLHRLTWNLRFPAQLVSGETVRSGTLVMPGTYSLTLSKRENGRLTKLAGAVKFRVVAERTASMTEAQREALVAFQKKVADLQGAARATLEAVGGLRQRVEAMKEAASQAPGTAAALQDRVRAAEAALREMTRQLRGDRVLQRHNMNTPPSLLDRINAAASSLRLAASPPTQTQRQQYEIAAREFEALLGRLRQFSETELTEISRALRAAGAPWIRDELPAWKHP